MPEQSKPRSLIERVVQSEGIVNFEAASDELKFRVYKVTLREVENILKQEDIAKRSLFDIKIALNDIENGFLYLLNRSKVNKREIHIVLPKLIDARAHLTTALTELGRGGRGKTYEYFRALRECKALIFEINQQLKDPLMNVKLTGQERALLHDALLRAFPSEGALEQPVYSQLGVKLPAIVGYNSSLDNVVYQLLNWAEKRGSLAELIEAARIANPGNAELQQCVKQYRTRIDTTSSATPQLPERALTAKLRQTLIQALLNIPETNTFVGRSALLVGVPGSLRRSPGDAHTDLALIIDQLSDLSRLKSGAWPLLIFIDNAIAYAEGTPSSKELQKVSQRVARRLYGEDYARLVRDAS